MLYPLSGSFLLFTVLLILKPVRSQQNAPTLAPLWGENQFGTDEISGAFKLLSEVFIPNASTYILDESALGPEKQFRLDLIRKDSGDASQTRGDFKSSIVTDGHHNDRSYFEPFRCKPFEQLDQVLSRDLAQFFIKPREPKYSFVMAGLSSMWLWASEMPADKQEYLRSNPDKVKTALSVFSWRRAIKEYDQIVIAADPALASQATNGLAAFNLAFYFQANSYQYQHSDVDSSPAFLNPEYLVAVHVIDPNSKKIVFRARIIELQTSLRAGSILRKQEDLFLLPVGFGCSLVTPRAVSIPPRTCLLDEGPQDDHSHLCRLEVGTFMPNEATLSTDHGGRLECDDVNKWRMQKSSLRLMSGRLFGQRLMAVELARAELGSRDSLARLKRIKKVWRISESHDKDEDAPSRTNINQESLDSFIEIDQSATTLDEARCLGFGYADYESSPTFHFAFPAALVNLELMGQKDIGTRIKLGLALGRDMLRLLFLETSGFFQIRDNPANWLWRRQVVQERRELNFKLHDLEGRELWTGPASIVRQFFVPSMKFNPGLDEIEVLTMSERQTRVTIHLFSKNVEQLLGRIHLTLSPESFVALSHLHRELDVGPCLDELLKRKPNSSQRDTLQARKTLGQDSLAFSIDYPIEIIVAEKKNNEESKSTNEEIEMDYVEDRVNEALQSDTRVREGIYEQFLANINKLMAKYQVQFNPMQLEDIQVDVSRDLVNIAAVVHRWPRLLDFVGRPNSALSTPSRQHSSALKELKASAQDCAESCDHYNCLAFTYCSTGNDGGGGMIKTCELVLHERQRSEELILKTLVLTSVEGCRFYTRKDVIQPHHAMPMSPLKFVDLLRGDMLSQSGDDESSRSLLGIDLKLNDSVKISLQPSYIESSSQPKGVLPSSSKLSDSMSYEEGRPQDDSNSIVAEYELVFENRRFSLQTRLSDEFPLQEATQIESLQECQQLCEENDCKSLAHCQDSQTCMISQLHETRRIQDHSETRSFCRILSREYLSKFHHLASKEVSSGLFKQWKSTKDKSIRLQNVASERDCAISCMDGDQSKCRSFLFCPKTMQPSDPDCVLFSGRQNSYIDFEDDDSMPEETQDMSLAVVQRCDYYKRSYLVEFDKFYGHRLPDSGYTLISLMKGFDAENCASECVETMLAGGSDGLVCKSFHVCLDTEKGNGPRLTCAISMGQANESYINSDQLEVANKCTTFLPIKRAMFVPETSDESLDTEDDDEDDNYDSDKKIGHSWLLTIFTVILGTGVGYAIAWVLVTNNYISLPTQFRRDIR